MAEKDRKIIAEGLEGVLAGGDLLASVVQGDRRRAGRADAEPAAEAPATREPPATPLVGGQPQAGERGDGPKRAPRAPRTRRAKGEDTPAAHLAGRLAEAERMAGSPTCTVTLRIPRAFNDWLDLYVRRSWPLRLRKQELVAEALRMLFARRGQAGEPLADTDLLPGGPP